MAMIALVGFTIVSYLIGAIPFAWLVAKAKGIDIRSVGSGNVGATNVFRSIGKGWGVLTFALDVAKGFSPAFLIPLLWSTADWPQNSGLLFGCAAIAGHNWPIYLKFKGGKGVATSAGVLLGVAPASIGIGLVVWLLSFAISRYVSLASILAAAAIPVAAWLLYGATNPLLSTVLTLLGGIVIWRHRSNIVRLRAGTEHRFDRRKVKS